MYMDMNDMMFGLQGEDSVEAQHTIQDLRELTSGCAEKNLLASLWLMQELKGELPRLMYGRCTIFYYHEHMYIGVDGLDCEGDEDRLELQMELRILAKAFKLDLTICTSRPSTALYVLDAHQLGGDFRSYPGKPLRDIALQMAEEILARYAFSHEVRRLRPLDSPQSTQSSSKRQKKDD